MQEIRQSIFDSSSGTIDSTLKSHTQGFDWLTLALPADIEQLTTDAGVYGIIPHSCSLGANHLMAETGSYIGAGYLLSSLDLSGDVSNYFRWLDLDSAVHGTQWTQGNTTFTR